MRKLDETIANLKLALADIETREKTLLQLQRQAGEQHKRIVNFALYEGGDLTRALQMMEEVGQRSQSAGTSLEHLKLIKSRAQEDLRAMMLTKTIEDAKIELAELQGRVSQDATLSDAIIELETRIAEASDLAGRLMMERGSSA